MSQSISYKSWVLLTAACFGVAGICCLCAAAKGRARKDQARQDQQVRIAQEAKKAKQQEAVAKKNLEDRINRLNRAGGLTWADLQQSDLGLLSSENVETLRIQLTSCLREFTGGKYIEVLSMTKPKYRAGHWNVDVTLNEPTYSIKQNKDEWTSVLPEYNAWEVCEDCKSGTRLSLDFSPRQSATFRNAKNEVTYARSQLMCRMRRSHHGRYYLKGSNAERDLQKLAVVLKDLKDSIRRDEAVRLADPVAKENLGLNRQRYEHLYNLYNRWSYDGDVIEQIPDNLKPYTDGMASWFPPQPTPRGTRPRPIRSKPIR